MLRRGQEKSVPSRSTNAEATVRCVLLFLASQCRIKQVVSVADASKGAKLSIEKVDAMTRGSC
jgi:hypothetical protein